MSARIEKVLTAGNADPAGPPVHENNTWLVGDDAEVVVIDPAHGADAVDAAVGGRRVVAVLITHGHWDHVREAALFAARHGGVARMHPADHFLWEAELGDAPFDALSDGDRFPVAGVELVAMHTPGHTPGCVCFAFDAEKTLVSGDTLFQGSIGRTDLPGGSSKRIRESLAKLMGLDDGYGVLPGHGPATRIGDERRANPFIAGARAEHFI